MKAAAPGPTRTEKTESYWGQLPPSTQIGLVLPLTVQQVVESTSASQMALHGHLLQAAAGAYWRQLPLTHISSRAQTLAQSPQFSGSVSVSTQATRPLPALHSVRPLAHPPLAAEHVPP